MTQLIPSALEIRCALARANVLEAIHGERSEIVQDAMLDVRDEVIELADRSFENGATAVPPMFSGTWLSSVWQYEIDTVRFEAALSEKEDQMFEDARRAGLV